MQGDARRVPDKNLLPEVDPPGITEKTDTRHFGNLFSYVSTHNFMACFVDRMGLSNVREEPRVGT
jgi:hypothetical protein